MRSVFYRRMGLVLGAWLLVWTEVASAFSYYDVSPQGPIGLSQPTVSQQINLKPGERIVGAELWLNGRLFHPSWDESGLISYRPTQPLDAGAHSGRLVVRVAPSQPGYFYAPVETAFTFSVLTGAVADLPQPNAEEQRALEVVNQHRRAAGLGLLAYDDRLAAAARSQAQYLALNPGQLDVDGHRQVQGRPGFTGETSADRARYFTYGGGSAEVINFVQRAEEAVAGWIDTPYHRIPLLHPGMTAMGYGLASTGSGTTAGSGLASTGTGMTATGSGTGAGAGQRINVAMVGPYAKTAGVVRWPYPGQTEVPPLWDGQETPDPFDLYPGTPLPVGYPITLIFGERPRVLRLTSWSLTGPEGPVTLLPFDPQRDERLEDTVAVIPKQPLATDASYTVRLRGEVDFGQGVEPFDYTWSFRTAAGYQPQLERSVLTTSSTGQELRSIRVAGVGLEQELHVFLGGLPVEGLVNRGSLPVDGPDYASGWPVDGLGAEVTFAPPVGYRGEAADLLVVTRDGHEATWRSFLTGSEGYRYAAGSAFEQVPLVVKGQRLAAPALVHRDGAVLLPAGEVLARLGGVAEPVATIGRTYWSLGGRSGEYTLGRVAASVSDLTSASAGEWGSAGAGERTPASAGWTEMRLSLPVQERLGQTYVDAAFVRALAGVEQQVMDGALNVGNRIAGLIDIEGHWAAASVQRLLADGVVAGLGDGTFRPDATLSRAAFVKMLVGATRTVAGTADASAGVGFSDTTRHWVADQGYLSAAVAAGIVRPAEYLWGRFEPDRAITREEMAVMVVRALGLEEKALTTALPLSGGTAEVGGRTFSDASSWDKPRHIAEAVRAGIITGYVETGGRFTFRPSQTATRAEAAVMVVRALEYGR